MMTSVLKLFPTDVASLIADLEGRNVGNWEARDEGRWIHIGGDSEIRRDLAISKKKGKR